ncbi:HAT family dimerization domain-containing protein [Favolaschia claudopus]|uniref:HAT family dimerization domain-containing protein n=1 Tax=Favolaschia claudopus TaxID=2862362 RepID=A0AAW0CQ53_9AGAR
MDFADPEAVDFDAHDDTASSFLDAIDRDPIATIRTIIRLIRSSSLRRQFLSEIIATLGLKNLELLRDVITRWSSTLLMIDRSLVLRPAIDHFLESNEFEEVSLYHFGDEEWQALEVFKKILDVPHAFQQKLSAEKTPTLCHALPAFEAMNKKWEQMQVEFPEASNIIQDGIDKLTSYQARIEDVPAYTLAMIINPRIKLRWLSLNRPEKLDWAKRTLKQALQAYDNSAATRPQKVTYPPTYDSWADEILGMEAPAAEVAEDSIDDEIAAYFADHRVGLNLLTFWEVSSSCFSY